MPGLVEERKKWRKEFENGKALNSPILDDYRNNRDSEMWRKTRLSERLCEYILFLEDKIKRLEK